MAEVPLPLQALFWGLVSGSALLIGAAIAYVAKLPARLVAAVMALGAGVLISAVAFELMDEALRQGGFAAAAGGFLGGGIVYTAANFAVTRRGGKHRKRSGANPDESQQSAREGAGLAIALGALLDGIPESVVIGASLTQGSAVSVAVVLAVFLSNLPEGLSSAAGMKTAGRSARYIFGVWAGVAALSGLAALLGNMALAGAAPQILAVVTAIAAGAILAMLVDTMIPEAFDETREFAGLITITGFLAAFALSKLGG